jgi:hypothetical protein
MNWKNKLKKIKSKIKIRYIKLKAMLPKIAMLLINIAYVLVWAIAVMLVLNIFLQIGIGIIQLLESMALYFIIEQCKPWIYKLNIYR